MNDKEGSNHEDLNQNNEIKINIEENQIKQNNPKNENNQLKGGEAFLGVLKDEEEKKEEEMEQKLREEKEFKKFETELEDEEIKQEEDIIKDEIIKEDEKEIEKAENEKKIKIKNELILPNEVDESKKVFKIKDIQSIKEVIIHNTKNPPPTRCYLTSEYSPKLKKIISLGGSDINSEQYDKIDLYDPITHQWSNYGKDFEIFNIKLSGQSSNLVNISCNNINDIKRTKEKIFLFGGYNNFLEDYTTHGFLIDTNDMTFEDISYHLNKEKKPLIPKHRSYHTANYDEENQLIYIYGGTDLNISNSKKDDFQCLWEYNLEGKYWNKRELKNCNSNGSPRGHSSILHKNKLYIFGGILLFKKFQNSLFTIDLKNYEIENIDYEKNQTSIVPKPTAFHSALKIDEQKFIIHGGLNQNYNTINDCYLYYFDENKFEKIEIPFLPKLFGHKLIMDNDSGSIFIIGGMDSFKYIGDENLIFSDDEEEDEENEKEIKQENIEINTKPMEQIFEIVLNDKEENKEIKEISLEQEERVKKKSNKKFRWVKYYI